MAGKMSQARAGRETCAQCGNVNFATDEACRRCHAALLPAVPVAALAAIEPVVEHGREHSLRRRLLWFIGITWLIVFIWSRSLVFTSEPPTLEQRRVVTRAIVILERAGFGKEVFVLRSLTNYRVTDSWWNLYQGHGDAYAATNFPLEIVTLYPPFFTVAADDTERAAILLHESQHLLGYGEDAALERTWRQKQRIGWTADQYGESKVWKNTIEWTASAVPALFQCGPDGHSDCS
jgi:hypothetical protein